MSKLYWWSGYIEDSSTDSITNNTTNNGSNISNLNNQINKLKTEQSDHKKKQNKIIDETLGKIK